MKRSIKIGERSIPLWIIVVLLVSIISVGVLGDYLWKTIFLSVEVKEPLEIVSYPSTLSLYPGETEEFNITIENHASVNYSVVLDFSLDNVTYQERYVTFSDETYNIIPDQQDLTAWLKVGSSAPPINTSLTIDFRRITGVEGEVLFFDDFNDGVADGWTEHLGTWSVIDGEYFATAGVFENVISTVDDLTIADCIIEAELRFTDAVGFRVGIVFRYTDNEHYYTFEISNEYDRVQLFVFTPENPDYGWAPPPPTSFPISENIDYTLRVEIYSNTFTGYLNSQEMISLTDGNYTTGKVGLRARRADAFFDNFKVTKIS